MEPTSITHDTICAISTPSGVGGIAVARVSGPEALQIASKIFRGPDLLTIPANSVRYGTVADSEGEPLDQAVVTVFRSPASFTGDDTVEISVHGSLYVQQELIASLMNAGARLAEPGEFTRRAFTNGKLDLAKAEAVADIIASNSRAAQTLALSQMRGAVSRKLSELRDSLLELSTLLELELDFSEEDVLFASRDRLLEIARDILRETTRLAESFKTGSAIKNGIPTAIIGPTNAGKSSLLNLLLADDRAIVSPIHGTTRDTIEELINIGPYTFRLIDTAGLRQTDDTIEQIGIDRSLQAARRARIILLIADPTSPDTDPQLLQALETASSLKSDAQIIAIVNKTDIATPQQIELTSAVIERYLPESLPVLHLSTLTADGIDTLRQTLTSIVAEQERIASPDGQTLITNARHAHALQCAAQSTQRVIDGLQNGLSGDFIAQDIRQTIHHLSEITGQISSAEILANIFSRFCIGK